MKYKGLRRMSVVSVSVRRNNCITSSSRDAHAFKKRCFCVCGCILMLTTRRPDDEISRFIRGVRTQRYLENCTGPSVCIALAVTNQTRPTKCLVNACQSPYALQQVTRTGPLSRAHPPARRCLLFVTSLQKGHPPRLRLLELLPEGPFSNSPHAAAHLPRYPTRKPRSHPSPPRLQDC